MGIIGHSSVEGFFREVLMEALEKTGTSATPPTEYYLVGLLGEFAKARISDTPMALRLVGSESPAERVQALKEIGDTSLYVTGFFSESIQRQLVDVDYYIGMGGTAYSELSHRMDGSAAAEVYAELSRRFPDFVEVLSHVRRQVNFGSEDIVKLYQDWVHTKADWIEEKLRRKGMLVGPSNDDKGYVQ